MRVWLIIGLLGFALLGACTQPLPRQDRPGAGRNDMVVVLPKPPDGHVGAVMVRPIDGGEPVLLNKAYVAANVGDAKTVQTSSIDAVRVNELFGSTLAALPAQPASFLVYFLDGPEEIQPDADQAIEHIYAEFAVRPSPEIAVIGHTDLVASDPYNDTLSLQRARRVQDLLVRRGIPITSIQVTGRGKREPQFPSADGVAEPRNRRVEISVR